MQQVCRIMSQRWMTGDRKAAAADGHFVALVVLARVKSPKLVWHQTAEPPQGPKKVLSLRFDTPQ